MPHAAPKREDFQISADVVTHIPTGAAWGAGDGVQAISFFKRGTLGQSLANGDDYCPEEVAAFAHKLLRERTMPAQSALPREHSHEGDGSAETIER
jgi:hypothetical protein